MSRTPKVTRELCEQLKSLSEDGLSVKGLAKFGRVSGATASVLKSKNFDYDAYREYSAQSFNILAKQNELRASARAAARDNQSKDLQAMINIVKAGNLIKGQPNTLELLEKLKLHIDQISVGLNLLLKEAQK